MTDIEAVYRAYFRDIYLYLLSLTRDEKLSEDLTSETFLKAMKNIGSFRGDTDIRVWLCQIGKNSYFSYLRKNRGTISIETGPELPSGMDLEQRISDRDSSVRIHRILHRMEEPYKEVFTLRFFGELGFRDIAALFGKSENWACVTYHRARKKIRERMEEKNDAALQCRKGPAAAVCGGDREPGEPGAGGGAPRRV